MKVRFRMDGWTSTGRGRAGCFGPRAGAIAAAVLALVSAAAGQLCPGDCDGDGRVAVNDVVIGVNMALHVMALAACPSFDRDHSSEVEIDELIGAVDVSLRGCDRGQTPFFTATSQRSATPTPTSRLVPQTPTASPAVSTSPSGLLLLEELDVPSGSNGTPHVFDLLVGDRIYLADSFGAAVAYSLGDDGLSFVFFSEPLLPAFVRCTSLALHAESRRLYCAATDVPKVALLDADTGELVGPTNYEFFSAPGYRDLHVVGDHLYLAAFDAGLMRATIAPDGSLGPIEPFLDGEVVGVDGDAGRLVILDRAKGLRIIEGGQEVRAIALDGPPMRLVVRGEVATVALGSRGAAVVDIVTGTVLVEAHPPCVATDADYRNGALAIACTSGLYLYQTEPELRTAGWVPATYASLGVRFIGDVLVATDWRKIAAYRIDLAGRAVGLDAPRGFLLESGQGIRFAVRNPDDREQHLNGRVLPPHGELMIDVPPGESDEDVYLATDEQDQSQPIRVRIARGKPPVSFGSPFPLSLSSRYVSFIQPDCALQFPALEDLMWLAAHGEPPGGLEPLVLLVPGDDDDPWPIGGFLRLWGQSPIEAQPLVEALPSEPSNRKAFEKHFAATAYLGGADTTVEFVVDAEGRVTGFGRVYRGAFPLTATVR